MKAFISGVLLLLSTLVGGQQLKTASHFSKDMAIRLADSRQVHDRLVIRFADHLAIRARDGQLGATAVADRQTRRELKQLNSWLRSKQLRPEPLFSLSEERLNRFRAQAMAQSGKTLSDLRSFVALDVPEQPGYQFIDEVAYLNQFSWVVVAYLEAPAYQLLDFDPPIDDIAPVGITPLLVNHQRYFYPAPEGVGLFSAWANPGAKGTGTRVMVYDNNYRASHEDLPNLFYTTGGNPVDEQHGTAVLGIIGAKHNGLGMKGGVYEAEVGFQQAASAGGSHANNLLNGAMQMGYGDVLVTEVGRKVNALGFSCDCNPTQANTVPIEFYPAEYQVIEQVIAAGITVVEAAGNGCVDFDDPVFQDMFNTDLQDSGAIWAGASLADQRSPTCYSNSGSRVNLHAWGEQVATLLFLRDDEVALFDEGLDRRYGPNFGGTSSAAPIIAACAASVQGQAGATILGPLSPLEVRSLLMETGQPQTGELNRPIGAMPNMENIAF